MRVLLVLMVLLGTGVASAQDVTVQLKEAANLERSLKENEAFEKYVEVLKQDAVNMKALLKCSELASGIGGRLTDKKEKALWYDKATNYATQALAVDSNSADAHYVKALAADKWKDIETENKKLVLYIREMKSQADRALTLNPNYGKANYIEGKWHFDIASMSWTKRSSLKVLNGGFADALMDSAFIYMEKCRAAEPYFVPNTYMLAKAYKADNKPQKALEMLTILVKLPTRTTDDVLLKAEGKKMMEEMQ